MAVLLPGCLLWGCSLPYVRDIAGFSVKYPCRRKKYLFRLAGGLVLLAALPLCPAPSVAAGIAMWVMLISLVSFLCALGLGFVRAMR
ncbi:hypothetical protein [Acetobacter sp. AN02]|uniref:hypothetical protein n=1 Tax=Acetobacter sp. AN02 TaxID=2894186 RepID=UPI0024342153|nr:hypothetical protein [Acetobacter sp. AN02]